MSALHSQDLSLPIQKRSRLSPRPLGTFVSPESWVSPPPMPPGSLHVQSWQPRSLTPKAHSQPLLLSPPLAGPGGRCSWPRGPGDLLQSPEMGRGHLHLCSGEGDGTPTGLSGPDSRGWGLAEGLCFRAYLLQPPVSMATRALWMSWAPSSLHPTPGERRCLYPG